MMLFLHLWHMIFFIFISLRLVSSLPIDTNIKSPNAIQPRGPGAKENWNLLRKHVMNSSKTGVFWSGTHNGESVKKSAEQHAKKVGGSTIGQDLKRSRISPPPHSASPSAKKEFWDTASHIKAEHSVGPVHVVLGSTVNKDGTWNEIEKPALMKNEKVPSISQIHPSTHEEVKKLKPEVEAKSSISQIHPSTHEEVKKLKPEIEAKSLISQIHPSTHKEVKKLKP